MIAVNWFSQLQLRIPIGHSSSGRVRAFAVSRFPAGDDEGVEHEMAPRAEVEREVDRLGHVTVGALGTQHFAAVLLEEVFSRKMAQWLPQLHKKV